MLDVATKYKQVFPRLDTPVDDDGSSIGHITADEWSKVEVIVEFLKEFYNFTNSVSGSNCVLVNRLYLYIAAVLNTLNEKVQSSDSICSSMASRMLKKCEKYWYGIEKLNVNIFIAMLLDPACKFSMMVSLFERLYGAEKGLELVMKIKTHAVEIFEEYKVMYAPSCSSSNGESSSMRPRAEVTRGSSTAIESFIEEMTAQSIQKSASTCSTNGSELEKFLGEELCHKYDVLTWWRQDGHRFPILARMARDVFAIPISTVPSESAFSAGGRTVDKYRSKFLRWCKHFSVLKIGSVQKSDLLTRLTIHGMQLETIWSQRRFQMGLRRVDDDALMMLSATLAC